VSKAVYLTAQAIPVHTSTGARLAISAAFAGMSMYSQALDAPGAPAVPSADLVAARARADLAIEMLRRQLPSPAL
jgi:hypothetical protein